jgi:octanoyl-[GcvH]:protein N-octanoyltransferase
MHILKECPSDPQAGLAREDELLNKVGGLDIPAVLRVWINKPCLVIGKGFARRIPLCPADIDGIPVLVRSSGGEVVAHHLGVLNITLTAAKQVWQASIEDAYNRFSQTVQKVLQEFNIPAKVGQVADSYCPGNHDISLEGKKIMGISQRRTADGILVHGALNFSVPTQWLQEKLRLFYLSAGMVWEAKKDRIGSLIEWKSPEVLSQISEAICSAFAGWNFLTG